MKGTMSTTGGAFVIEAAPNEWNKLDSVQKQDVIEWARDQPGNFFYGLSEQAESHGLSDKQLAIVFREYIPHGVTPSKDHMACIEKEWETTTEEARNDITEWLKKQNWSVLKDMLQQIRNGKSLTDQQLQMVKRQRGQHAPASGTDSTWKALGKEGRERYTQYLSNRAQGAGGGFVKSLYEQLLSKDYLTNNQLDKLDEIMRRDPVLVKQVDKKENVKSPGKTNLDQDELVDHKIRIWWKGKYHDVKVTQYSRMFHSHRLQFEDNEIRWLQLGKEKIEHANPPEELKAYMVEDGPGDGDGHRVDSEFLNDTLGWSHELRYYELMDATGRVKVWIGDNYWQTTGGLRRAKMDARLLMKGE